MGRNRQPKGGGYAEKQGKQSYARGGTGGGNNKKTAGAAAALGYGLPQQNAMLLGLAGPGMTHQNPMDSLFGSAGTSTIVGLGGSIKGLQYANSGNVPLRLAALLGGSQQQPVSFQPPQLLQVQQALAQQQATQAAAQQAELQKRIEAEATKRAAELVKNEKEKQKQKSAQDM